ncbi:UNVERIFIED_CONTAM: hypothetical protein PYX00_009711 [Menopon gallinae]|uniref:Solute carrier family 35 member F2 n=1 Tax=Menopon gallinae TaxID=328185 RepID=A0AAW2HCD9_9NEOP
MPSTIRQYLLVDNKKCRRNSAPEYLGNYRSPYGSRILDSRHYWLRASTSDLSVLLDNQSESGSSLELDTSNLSRELSPAPTTKDNLSEASQGSYQSIPLIHFEIYRRREEEYSVWNVLRSWSIWRIVFLSQIMAGCLTVMDYCNKYMKTKSHNVIVAGHCFANYIFLSVLWTTRLACRNDERGILEVLKLSGLRYVLLSVLHVEANYFLLSSFQEDSYMGNQMIDLIAASLSLVLAYVCLEVQFQLTHVNGFALSIIGGIGFCVANAVSKTGEDDISWGDILRIGSGIFLALNNLAQELIVKSIDSVEYLGMIGFLGSFISGLQTILLNGNKTLIGNSYYWTSVISFSAVQFAFSCLAPLILRDIGTTGLHLALISSEFYSYLIYWLNEKDEFQLLYIVSYALVLLGFCLFVLKRTTIGTHYFFPVKVIIPKGS